MNGYAERPHYAKWEKYLKPGFEIMLIFFGVRGSGKTWLLRRKERELLESGVPREKVVYLDLEDPECGIRDEMDFYNRIEEDAGGPEGTYILLDEPGCVKDWERTARWFIENGAVIIAAKSLFDNIDSEYRTRIGALHWRQVIGPLTLSEFSDMRGGGDPETLLEEYYRCPGMAQDGWDQDNILGDIAGRRRVRRPEMLRKLLETIAANDGCLEDPEELTEAMGGSIDPRTVERYIGLLRESMLVYRAEERTLDDRWSRRGFLYVTDRTMVPEGDARMRNILFWELMNRSGCRVQVGTVEGVPVALVTGWDRPEYWRYVAFPYAEEWRSAEELLSIRDNYPKTILTRTDCLGDDCMGIRVVKLVDWLLDSGRGQGTCISNLAEAV
ncbi:MAG: AAA family ATPase [Thermoplasmata archaeon]|nr:AAA family ATPase [Thermoplasmata archaeon]